MIDVKPTIYHYTGDGVAIQYFYPAPIYSADELIVRVDSQNVTGYTVDLQTANGKPADLANPVVSAIVTFDTAPAAQSVVSLRQNILADQTVDYSPFERFPADLHEQAIDKQTLVSQRIQDELKYKIGLDPDQPLPTYNVIFPPYEALAIPQWSETEEGILENFQLGDALNDLQAQITQNANDIATLETVAAVDVAANTAHRLDLNNPHGTPTRFVQEVVPVSAVAGDEWVIPSTGGTYVLLSTGNWVQTNPGNVFGTAPVLPPPVASAIVNDSGVTGASVADALNTNKSANEGSVTIHSDITDAGSGSIITAAERAGIVGSVTAHSDVSNAGSGQIITSTERSQLSNANNHANGSVTDHTDVTSAGSGQIITTTERNNISNANSHANGSVTDHSDVTSAGSGQIISTAERTLLNNLGGGNMKAETYGGTVAFVTATPTGYGYFAAGANPGFSLTRINTGRVRVTHNLGVQDAILQAVPIIEPGNNEKWTANFVDVTTNAFTVQLFNTAGNYVDTDFHFTMEREV